jgi:hypothetical protein
MIGPVVCGVEMGKAMNLPAEIVFAILRTTPTLEKLTALLESYGDLRALEMRREAEQLADRLGAPHIASAIHQLVIGASVDQAA